MIDHISTKIRNVQERGKVKKKESFCLLKMELVCEEREKGSGTSEAKKIMACDCTLRWCNLMFHCVYNFSAYKRLRTDIDIRNVTPKSSVPKMSFANEA